MPGHYIIPTLITNRKKHQEKSEIAEFASASMDLELAKCAPSSPALVSAQGFRLSQSSGRERPVPCIGGIGELYAWTSSQW